MAASSGSPGPQHDQTVHRAFLENLPLVAWAADADAPRVFYVNRHVERLLGYAPVEWTEDAALRDAAIHPEDRERFADHLARVRARGTSHVDFRALHRDGAVVWMRDHAVLVRDADGRPRYIQGFGLDISDQRRAEEALRESEERYRLIVETAAQGVWVIDADGNTTFANDALGEMLGVSADEMVGKNAFDFLPPEVRELPRFDLELVRAGERRQFERQLLLPTGSRIDAIFTTSPLTTADGEYAGALAMVTDVTERKRLAAELERTNRLEAIGGLAGGVAHDFNNSMMAIRGFAELLLAKLDEGHPLRAHVEGIVHAADGATALTRQLLAYGRRQVLRPEVLDLNEVVKTLEPLLRRALGSGIELTLELGNCLGAVNADHGRLDDVLLELAANARDAMPDGGELTIRTSQAGSDVVLEVVDEGLGMDAHVRDRAFEPFFTTKEVGLGAGMGLATVYGIVMQSGGRIELESERERGTTMRIYLPTVAARNAEEGAREVGGPRPESILLVEDEPVVRALVAEMVAQLGYRVRETASAEEALELAADESTPIDLLITDVVMPSMGGTELATRLRELRPSLRVLYVSGYPRGAISSEDALEPGSSFLQKPFTLDLLHDALDRLVGEGAVEAQVTP
jgi:two-component system, cell cycle sensor histidine kinase and response regulator CckA